MPKTTSNSEYGIASTNPSARITVRTREFLGRDRVDLPRGPCTVALDFDAHETVALQLLEDVVDMLLRELDPQVGS